MKIKPFQSINLLIVITLIQFSSPFSSLIQIFDDYSNSTFRASKLNSNAFIFSSYECLSVPKSDEWNKILVDDFSGTVANTSIDVDENGYPHIAYHDSTAHALKYAYYDGNQWHYETVHNTGNTGLTPFIKIDSNGHPHIAWLNYSIHYIQYAYHDGTNWNFHTFSGYWPHEVSMDLDSHDRPHVTYFTDGPDNIMYAWYDGSTWQESSIKHLAHYGARASIKVDSLDRPHIVYTYDYDKSINYARYDNGWIFEYSINLGEPISGPIALNLDSSDRPHIAVENNLNSQLKYFRKEGNNWLNYSISNATYGKVTLEIDSHDQAHIGFLFDRNGSIEIAHAEMIENGWSCETVSKGTVPFLSINTADIVYLSYANESSDLWYAIRSGEPITTGGKYRNLFSEYLGKSDAEVVKKIEQAYKQLFFGWDVPLIPFLQQRVYYEVAPDMAFIKDIYNNDIRSEGMSYGMMIAVQMNDKEVFNRLWKWAKTYMYQNAGARHGYFAWQMNEDGTIKNPNPAPDGEEYFAMSLFFASALWGDNPDPNHIFNYKNQANAILDALRAPRSEPDDLSNCGTVTNMFSTSYSPYYGPQVIYVPCGNSALHTNPSYHLPAFYELWGEWAANDQVFWKEAAVASRKLLQKAANEVTGFSPNCSTFQGIPYDTSTCSDEFSYDAWRVSMNKAVDYSWFRKDPWQGVQSNNLLSFLNQKGIDTYEDAYTVDGIPLTNTVEPSIGLRAMNAVAALAVPDTSISREFVKRLWDAPIPTGPSRYYDGMLYMLGLLHVGGQFRIYQPTSSQSVITTSNGGDACFLMGMSYIASFSPASVGETITVTIGLTDTQPTTFSSLSSNMPILAGHKLVGKAFFIEAINSNGSPVTSFTAPFTITVNYDGKDILNINETSLSLYDWNSALGEWEIISTAVKTDENSLVSSLNHLTAFSVFGEPQYLMYLPAIFSDD